MKPGHLPREIVSWLLLRDTSGGFPAVARAELGKAFPAHDATALDTALHELETRGMVRHYHKAAAANGDICAHDAIGATLSAALESGRHATGFDIDDDAIRIARKFLKYDKYRHIPRLYDRLGWDLRRLNPPLLLIRSLLGDENFGPTRTPPYAFTDFTPTRDTIALLRTWVANGSTIASTEEEAAMSARTG